MKQEPTEPSLIRQAELLISILTSTCKSPGTYAGFFFGGGGFGDGIMSLFLLDQVYIVASFSLKQLKSFHLL